MMFSSPFVMLLKIL